MIILIDNGHGIGTLGKRSPDGRLKEWKWNREIATLIVGELKRQGYDARLLVPEDNDISLKERCRRVNAICKERGAKNVVLISIHVNAAGADGKWHDATGWSGWVAPNASANSKLLARLLYEEAEARGLKGNRFVPAEKYWVGNLAMVRDTACPAVLTENLFMDSVSDLAVLLSARGKEKIVSLHVEGVKRYMLELR